MFRLIIETKRFSIQIIADDVNGFKTFCFETFETECFCVFLSGAILLSILMV